MTAPETDGDVRAAFRSANDSIAARARALAIAWRVPFICECDDAACHALIPLSLEEYAEARAAPTLFVLVRGHGLGRAAIVIDRESYVIVDAS